MFVAGDAGNDINEYTLSTAFDVSTASFVDAFSVAGQETYPQGVAFNTAGTKMFVIGSDTDNIYQYSVANTAPVLGHSADNILGTATQDTDGTGNINIPFKIKDAETDNCTTKTWQYSDNGGSTWNSLTAGDMTGEDGTKSSAIDWTGTEYTIVWNSKNQIDSTDQNDIQFSFSVNDGTVDSATAATANFTVDNLNPAVSTLSPLDNAPDTGINDNLIITFNETVNRATGNITIKKTSDDTDFEIIPVTDARITGTGTTTITINPTNTFDSETEYYVLIDATAFDDPSGNSYAGISSTTAWSFITADAEAPTITNISSDKTDGSYTIGEVIDVDLTFSEAVTSTGDVTITLETGTTDRTCTFTISNSTTGTCDYTVQTGDTTSDLNVNNVSGTINDQSSNPVTNYTPATNLADNKNFIIDTTAPTPASFSTNPTANSATSISMTATTAIDAGVGKHPISIPRNNRKHRRSIISLADLKHLHRHRTNFKHNLFLQS